MSGVKTYRDLKVWQKSMALVIECYQITKALPKSEIYGLTSQIQRAAVSVPTNIAEGNARGSRRDYARFVDIARGSVAELDTLLTVCAQVGLVAAPDLQRAMALSDEVGRMLNTLKQRLSIDPAEFEEGHNPYIADDPVEIH